MIKFGVIGLSALIAVAVAATSPVFAEDGFRSARGFQGGGHFAGSSSLLKNSDQNAICATIESRVAVS